MKLFDATNIEELVWPETEEGSFAKKLLLPLVQNGVDSYFSNIKTEMRVLSIDHLVLPVTINDAEANNSYVCSFYSYYIGYGLNATMRIKNKILKKSIQIILKCLGSFLKLGKIDKVVSVNNWLFSTNIHPKLTDSQVLKIKTLIQNEFPSHAIVFRSVKVMEEYSCIKALKNNQFDLVATRQIFFTDPKKAEVFESRLFKSDLKFLKSTDYELGGLNVSSKEELFTSLSLYHSLYLEKYSSINPCINESFMQLVADHNLFKFKTLKKNGKIEGVVGHYSMYGTMMSPFFGYNPIDSGQIGLYRLLSTILALESKNSGAIFHQSSGASFYKSIRKAIPCIEYTAVYTKHLPLRRRFPWKALQAIMNYCGIHWMKKY